MKDPRKTGWPPSTVYWLWQQTNEKEAWDIIVDVPTLLLRPDPSSLAQATTCSHASQEDLREYLVYLDHTNLSEAQKIELLQTLWSIISAFVDLSFGIDPVQQMLPSASAGKDADDPTIPSRKAGRMGAAVPPSGIKLKNGPP